MPKCKGAPVGAPLWYGAGFGNKEYSVIHVFSMTLFNSAYISNGGQRVVLVFNKAHCFAHKNLPPATFYLRSPMKMGAEGNADRRPRTQ